MTTFKTNDGKEYQIAVSVGVAGRLRDELGIDLDKFIDRDDPTFQSLLTDVWKLTALAEFLTRDQRSGDANAFYESLDGDSLDDFLKAFLKAVCLFFPRIKRGPIETFLKKMDSAIESASDQIEKVFDDTFEQELKKVTNV